MLRFVRTSELRLDSSFRKSIAEHEVNENIVANTNRQATVAIFPFRIELNARYPINKATTPRITALIGQSIKICNPLSEISNECRKFDSVIKPKITPIITEVKTQNYMQSAMKPVTKA